MENNIDMKKLEKLACLQLKAEHSENIKKSIIDVMDLMSSVIAIEVQTLDSDVVPKFENSNIVNKEFKRDELKLGNMTEDGYFLAPKVIKKD